MIKILRYSKNLEPVMMVGIDPNSASLFASHATAFTGFPSEAAPAPETTTSPFYKLRNC